MSTEIRTERIEDLLFKDTKPILELKLEYPQIYGKVSEKCENGFNTYYLKSAARTNIYVRTEIYKNAVNAYKNSLKTGFPFNFMTFERTLFNTFNGGSFISLYFDTYKYEGGAHGMTIRTAETWSLTTGGIIPIASFFVKGFDFRRYVTERIAQAVTLDLEDKESVYYKNAPERCKQLFNEKRYYLSDTGFIFYYPSYSIAPYCAGIRTFEIPFEDFGKNLKYIPTRMT